MDILICNYNCIYYLYIIYIYINRKSKLYLHITVYSLILSFIFISFKIILGINVLSYFIIFNYMNEHIFII